MIKVTVLYVFEDATTAEETGHLFDSNTVLMPDADMWRWITFSQPVELTEDNKLVITPDSDYKGLELPSINVDPASLQNMTIAEYIAQVILESNEGE